MCYGAEAAWVPAAVAAVAGTGSAYAANQANNRQIEAEQAKVQQERFRQAELQRQSDEDVRRSLQEFTPEKHESDVQQATDVRTAALQAPQIQPDQYHATTPQAAVEVKGDLGRKLAAVQNRGQLEASRRAQLGAYGDASMKEGFDMNRMREALRQRGMQSQGQSRVLPYELRETDAGGKNAAAVAGILSNVASQYSVGAGAKKPGGIGYGTADPTTAGPGLPY